MSADRTTVEVSRAMFIYTLDRRAASDLIRDLAHALATEDTIEMQAIICPGREAGEREMRVGVRTSIGSYGGPLLYSVAEIAGEAR
jgi:hypothetical protein